MLDKLIWQPVIDRCVKLGVSEQGAWDMLRICNTVQSFELVIKKTIEKGLEFGYIQNNKIQIN